MKNLVFFLVGLATLTPFISNADTVIQSIVLAKVLYKIEAVNSTTLKSVAEETGLRNLQTKMLHIKEAMDQLSEKCPGQLDITSLQADSYVSNPEDNSNTNFEFHDSLTREVLAEAYCTTGVQKQ